MLKLFRRATDPKQALKELIGDFEIPTMSKAALQVLELLRDRDSKDAEIVALIEMDPGMNVRILRTVNSAAMGLSQTVKSVHHAITLLGRARLETLVLSTAVQQSVTKTEIEGFDPAAFWLQSSRRASAARALCKLLNDGVPAEVFTAALLQDIGVSLLAQAHGLKHADLVAQWIVSPTGPLSEWEQRELNQNHVEVGALLAQHWELPDFFIDSIAGHEDLEADNGVPNSVKLVSVMRGDFVDSDIERVVEACTHVAEFDGETLRGDLAQASEDAESFFRAMN